MKLLGPIDQIRKKVKKLKTGKYLKKKNVIRKLKITEEDFRKLCIYKGIYPVSYKKVPASLRGKFAKEKICYPREVLKKLSHEKVIHYFRKKQSVLRKYTASKKHKQDNAEAKKIVKHFPKLTLDHIIKKRFPNFSNTIEHLTDAITTISVYSHLVPMLVGGFNAHLIFESKELIDHFHYYIYKTNKLTKAFIAVDRYYLQANIMEKDVTWVIPSGPSFSSWNKITNTQKVTEFVEYYIVFVKYVLLKLYMIENMKYPPTADEYLITENFRHLAYDPQFVESVKKAKEAKKMMNSDQKIEHDKKNSTNEPKTKEENKKMETKDLNNVTNVTNEKSSEKSNEKSNEKTQEETRTETKTETKTETETQAQTQAQTQVLENITGEGTTNLEQKRKNLFKDQVYLIYYNQPLVVLSLIIMSCGGKIALDNDNSPYLYKSKFITHEICNKQNKFQIEKSKKKKYKRNLIHPQYVFDCLNQNELLPCEQYFYDNATMPPHLSPFADYEKIKKARERRQTIGLQYLEHMKNKEEKRINKMVLEKERRENLYDMSKRFVKKNMKEIQKADEESGDKLIEQEEKNMQQEKESTEESKQKNQHIKKWYGQNINNEEYKRMRLLMSKRKKRLYDKIIKKEQKEEKTIESLMENAKNIFKKEAEAAQVLNAEMNKTGKSLKGEKQKRKNETETKISKKENKKEVNTKNNKKGCNKRENIRGNVNKIDTKNLLKKEIPNKMEKKEKKSIGEQIETDEGKNQRKGKTEIKKNNEFIKKRKHPKKGNKISKKI